MNLIRYATLAAFLCGMVLSACGGDAEESAPAPAPKPAAKPVVAEKAPAVKAVEQDDDPVLQSMSGSNSEEPVLQSMSGAKEQAADSKQATDSRLEGPVVQSDKGPYVIQVGIQPSKKGANAIVKKLEEKGVKAYLSEVENPGELEGTYYRVRVGYFETIHIAQEFGKTILEPAGFPWWVDKSSNDAVGNPAGSESVSSYTESYSSAPAEPVYSVPANEPAPEETPVENVPMESAEGSVGVEPAPVEEAPAVEQASVADAAPMAEPAPAAPAAPAASSDDFWD